MKGLLTCPLLGSSCSALALKHKAFRSKARVEEAMRVQHHAVIRTTNNAHDRDSSSDWNGLRAGDVPDIFDLRCVVLVRIGVSVALPPSVPQPTAVDLTAAISGLSQEERVAVAASNFIHSRQCLEVWATDVRGYIRRAHLLAQANHAVNIAAPAVDDWGM